VKNGIRFHVILAATVCLAGLSGFAQSTGEATYKAKCQNCHGAAGLADTAIGLAWKIKPVTDPEVKKMGLAEMIEITRNGKGKMQTFKDKLSDAEIKAAVEYFRTLVK
jgi:mono/diheme cytochrome c family protein